MYNRRVSTAVSYRKKKRIVFMTIGVLISIYLILRLIFGSGGVISYFGHKSIIAKIREETKILKKQNAEIKKEIDEIRNRKDSTLLETKAREFGLTMPGELIYKYTSEEPDMKGDDVP